MQQPAIQYVPKTDVIPANTKGLWTIENLVSVIQRYRGELNRINPQDLAQKVLEGLYAAATESEVNGLLIQISSALSFEEPQYSKLAARFLSRQIARELGEQQIHGFESSILHGCKVGVLSDKILPFVTTHRSILEATIRPERDRLFEYLGLRTVYDRYLLRDPETRLITETPQFFFLRVAVGISDNIEDVVDLYNRFSTLEYLPSSPTLFNSATTHQQLSSCFLLDSPEDNLEAIYRKYLDVAMLSKFAGGIGLAYHRVRAAGSLIKGTNGDSRGVIPFLNTLDASVAAVNQGGRRKGAACVYLETWHADIESFLELRDNTGEEARRTHNLNLSNWVPDLFMQRVAEDGMWSLFDPKTMPQLVDTYGEVFEKLYTEAETNGLYHRQVKARDLYAKMMRTLAQTGNGWMCFKDAANKKCNQTGEPGNVVHLSNLCTEIVEVTSPDETAVCNLGSINLARHVKNDQFDFAMLADTTRVALRQLDRVIDRNYYPIKDAESSNRKWRPVGLGCMGLQDVFFQLRLAFDSEEAKEISTKIAEEIYFGALQTSCELAEKHGPHPSFRETRAAKGEFEFERWGVVPSDMTRWEQLRKRIVKHGLRNSLMIAIAPTATIASIVGCYECIEPQVSNLFKRETLSGEFLQVNRYLVADLQARNMWNEMTRSAIKAGEGSIQHIEQIPQDLRDLYRTAWELPMRSIIDLAAARGPYVDQSQSLNLFMATPNIGKLSSMYYYAWQSGLKTTYYLRSRPATKIAQTTTAQSTAAVACSLENPEYCEACQ